MTKKKKETKEQKNTTPQSAYIKHLVECKCILPQFRKMKVAPFHKFIVFSELEKETALIKPSFSQCPNCGAIHKIKEVGESSITNKDSSLSLPTIEDIELELPDKMIKLLVRHECDLPTWQEVKFIFDNNIWGSVVILTKEHINETVVGKYITILSRDTYKIDSFERFEGSI